MSAPLFVSSPPATASTSTPGDLLADLGAKVPIVFTPEQVTRYLHLRANDLAGADGSALATWTDLSGNSRDAVQATGGNQPTVKIGLNGRKCVRFASGKFMTKGSLGLALPYTVFVVAYIPRGTGYRFMWSNSAGGGMYAANVGSLTVSGSLVPLGDGNTAVYSHEMSSGKTRLRRNGRIITDVAAAALFSGLALGTDDATTQTFTSFDGDIYEFLIVPSVLTDYQRAGIEQALCAFYGLPYAGSEGTVGAVLASPSVNSTNTCIWTPPDFDKYRPTPLLLVSHGGSKSEVTVTQDDFVRVVDTALQMGFIVAASAEHGTDQSVFSGTTQGLADDKALYDYIVANIAPTISKTVVGGVSYGGINSALNMSRLTNVVGRIGLAPVCDTTVGPASTNAIANPMTESTSLYSGKRMISFASAGDGTVSKTSHTDAFHSRLASVLRESTVVAVSGGHIDETHYQPVQVAQFLARCLSDS